MDKNKKSTTNPTNKKDSRCFQYAMAVPLNHEETGKRSEKITKIKPFVNKYNWLGIQFPSEKGDCKKFEKNNLTIALNVLYVKKEKYTLLMFQNITQIVKNKLFL